MTNLTLSKEELCLISIALNEYQMELDNYHLDEMRKVSSKIDNLYHNYYPIKGLTIEDIFHAIEIYIERIEKGDLEYVHYSWGEGDSLDRERVRDIILEQPQFSWSS